jgi:hypothetical protein
MNSLPRQIEELENKSKNIDVKSVATREDIKAIELKIAELEIRIINKMQWNTWTIIVAVGILGLLNHWIFK